MRDIIRQEIVDSVTSPVPAFTRRALYLPNIKGGAVAVMDLRQANACLPGVLDKVSGLCSTPPGLLRSY